VIYVPLTDEQKAIIVKMWKYYDKHREMIEEYKKPETKEVAVSKYRSIFPVRAARYEKAWKGMPKAYEAKMTAVDDRIKNWILSFSKKMFGVVPSDTEIRTLVDEIKRYLA
jgi:hypothetical protein